MWSSGEGDFARMGCRLVNVFHLCLLGCVLVPAIGSLSLKPPAEEILNKHLCPNPVLSATSKLLPSELSKILTVRLQPRTGTNTYFSRLIRPCSFIEDPTLSSSPSLALSSLQSAENTNVTTIRIQSINLNTSPWNFSTASDQCSKFIMFRSWNEYGNGYPVMCGRENFDQFLGPYGHPMILYYHLRDEGMSFPLFHPNYEPPNSRRDHQQRSNILELKYMLIYYSIRSPDGTWTCRLQQYTINPMRESCPSWSSSSSTHSSSAVCGEYPCGVLDALYQRKMGVMQGDGGDFQQQRFIIVKSKTQEKYRVRNFLRQKFVPIIFLVILICAYKTYMKAGLRLHHEMPMPVSETRLRRYNSQRHNSYHHHGIGRDPFRDIYFDGYGEEGGPGNDNNGPTGLHIPYEPSSPMMMGGGASGADAGGGVVRGPAGDLSTSSPPCTYGKYVVHPSDPPPSYDTLFPPSYNELFYAVPTLDSSATTANSNAATTAEAKNPKV